MQVGAKLFWSECYGGSWFAVWSWLLLPIIPLLLRLNPQNLAAEPINILLTDDRDIVKHRKKWTVIGHYQNLIWIIISSLIFASTAFVDFKGSFWLSFGLFDLVLCHFSARGMQDLGISLVAFFFVVVDGMWILVSIFICGIVVHCWIIILPSRLGLFDNTSLSKVGLIFLTTNAHFCCYNVNILESKFFNIFWWLYRYIVWEVDLVWSTNWFILIFLSIETGIFLNGHTLGEVCHLRSFWMVRFSMWCRLRRKPRSCRLAHYINIHCFSINCNKGIVNHILIRVIHCICLYFLAKCLGILGCSIVFFTR